jgi:crotonobetainyl-CoA:carnitine CoA-transferase CaiB-like acyl-CoA transferase
MTGMLLADHGASVIKVEPPGGDPYRSQLGYAAWQRGKRSLVLDLCSSSGRTEFYKLAADADVLIEAYAPGVTAKLGIDYEALHAINPRLVYCSITGYGRGTSDATRPAYDALVQARVGLLWEQRGWPEGAVSHIRRRPDPCPNVPIQASWVQGADRPGPIFPASPWPSIGACYSAALGISAALYSRETTHRGQLVETSLLQGALASATCIWQRVEHDPPGFNSWIFGNRAPKGQFECKDGRWIVHWVPNPRFVLTAGAGESLQATPDLSVRNDPHRIAPNPEDLAAMAHYQPILMETLKKFVANEWVEAAANAKVIMQPVRSAEEALADPHFFEDGCVTERTDAEHGRLRMCGLAYRFSKCPVGAGTAAPSIDEHGDLIRAALQSIPETKADSRASAPSDAARPPLSGITVLDVGLAIAGPYGAQLLSDLGATVIKISAPYDYYYHRMHIAYAANRGKKSITLNLKDPRGLEIFRRLAASADVVHHNMRYSAARRLGIDYETLKAINSKLIYCHTRGFEKGPREELPANDQTGAALTGVEYEDGGMARGGKPFWSLTAFGDTGSGFLSAIAVVQALYHRHRTGEGQFVDTSIVSAQLLNMSYVVARPDGSGLDRPRIDGMQLGFSAGYRMYETAEGWLCLALASPKHWDALLTCLELTTLSATSALQKPDDELGAIIGSRLRAMTASEWFKRLDAAGVPVEIVSDEFSLKLHDDQELKRRRWTASYQHPDVGRLDQVGLSFDLSDTPGVIQGRPLIVGEDTQTLLRGLGYSDAAIAKLEADMVIGLPGKPRTSLDSRPQKAAPTRRIANLIND